jgi:hypothetical protein|uniref:hypothetical protein n=1 Tax=Prosthecobacter sp. TaxID=1965333 RepID=UPI0037843CC2
MKCLLSVLFLSSISLLVAVFSPYGRASFGNLAFILVLAAMFVTLIAMNYRWHRTRTTRPSLLLAAVPAMLAYFVCTTRQAFDEIIPMGIDATVARLYRSQNHQHPGIELEGASHEAIRIEPVPEESWIKLRVGDHVTKEPFTTYLKRGDERVPAVEPSLFHAIRGASS